MVGQVYRHCCPSLDLKTPCHKCVSHVPQAEECVDMGHRLKGFVAQTALPAQRTVFVRLIGKK